MITPDQLNDAMNADRVDPTDSTTDLKYTPLTGPEQMLIENLVKNYSLYAYNLGMFPGLSTKLDTEQATPTDKTYMLKAILEALNNLPEVSADSQGTDKAPSFFSTTSNWGILAQDVLNTFYNPAGGVFRRSYANANKPVRDLVLNDSILIPRSKTGRRY